MDNLPIDIMQEPDTDMPEVSFKPEPIQQIACYNCKFYLLRLLGIQYTEIVGQCELCGAIVYIARPSNTPTPQPKERPRYV
jgi:hypothetical protein